jgi:hypothetical protein
VLRGSSRRLCLLALLVGVAALVPGAAAPAGIHTAAGFKPRPLFTTPGQAAYCYVDGATMVDARPRLFCWTPNDGYGIHLIHRGGRPYAGYYTRPSPIAHGYDSLVGWAPRAPMLGFGRSWALYCTRTSDSNSCREARRGRLTISCVSRRTGLTCRNTLGHGFWLGRYRGVRRF